MARLSRERTKSGDPIEITPYLIELHFNQLADQSDRLFFNSVPTSLQLPSKSVDRLRQLAARELATNEESKRLVHDLPNVASATVCGYEQLRPRVHTLPANIRDRSFS